MNKACPRWTDPTHASGPRSGFSLVEVVLAFVLLEFGLLASAGMIFSAQRTLARARLIQRGAMEAGRTADSLQETGWTTRGMRLFPGGSVEWIPESEMEEGVRVFALGSEAADTLVRLRTWSLEDGSGPPQEPEDPSYGGGVE